MTNRQKVTIMNEACAKCGSEIQVIKICPCCEIENRRLQNNARLLREQQMFYFRGKVDEEIFRAITTEGNK